MNWVLELLDLDWIGLENSRLQPYDGYFIFYITPKWNIPKLMENFKDQIIALIENLGDKYDDLVNDTEIDQQELLNWFIVLQMSLHSLQKNGPSIEHIKNVTFSEFFMPTQQNAFAKYDL